MLSAKAVCKVLNVFQKPKAYLLKKWIVSNAALKFGVSCKKDQKGFSQKFLKNSKEKASDQSVLEFY
jgi:hypothetical protein